MDYRKCFLLMLPLVGIVLVIAGLFFAIGQIEILVTYELNADVTSDTALWVPGTHTFRLNGTWQLQSPLDSTFEVDGSGTVTYSCASQPPFPPCQLDFNLTLESNISGTIPVLGGKVSVSITGQCETDALQTPTTGFIRTEEVRDLVITGTYSLPGFVVNGIDWDSTTALATVDFSHIDNFGTSFRIRVRGTSQVSLADTPPSPIPEFPIALGFSLIVLPLYRLRKDRVHG